MCGTCWLCSPGCCAGWTMPWAGRCSAGSMACALGGCVQACIWWQRHRLCFELVDQRPALRCHARCGQFCADAAGLPPLRHALQIAKRQIGPTKKEKRCPRLLPGGSVLCQGVSQGKSAPTGPTASPGRFMMGASSSEIKKNRDSNIIPGLLSYCKSGDFAGSLGLVRCGGNCPFSPCIRLSRANYCRTLNVEKPEG